MLPGGPWPNLLALSPRRSLRPTAVCCSSSQGAAPQHVLRGGRLRAPTGHSPVGVAQTWAATCLWEPLASGRVTRQDGLALRLNILSPGSALSGTRWSHLREGQVWPPGVDQGWQSQRPLAPARLEAALPV